MTEAMAALHQEAVKKLNAWRTGAARPARDIEHVDIEELDYSDALIEAFEDLDHETDSVISEFRQALNKKEIR